MEIGAILFVLLLAWLFLSGPSGGRSSGASKPPSPEQRQAASRAGVAAARRAAVDDLMGRSAGGEVSPEDRDAMLEALFASRPTRGPGAPPHR